MNKMTHEIVTLNQVGSGPRRSYRRIILDQSTQKQRWLTPEEEELLFAEIAQKVG